MKAHVVYWHCVDVIYGGVSDRLSGDTQTDNSSGWGNYENRLYNEGIRRHFRKAKIMRSRRRRRCRCWSEGFVECSISSDREVVHCIGVPACIGVYRRVSACKCTFGQVCIWIHMNYLGKQMYNSSKHTYKRACRMKAYFVQPRATTLGSV